MRLLVLVLGLSLLPAQSETTEQIPLQKLLTSREYSNYNRKPRYRDRMDLYRKAFERQGRLLAHHVRAKRAEQAVQALHRLRELSRHAAGEEPLPDHTRDVRSRQAKKLEIALRKLLDSLDNLKTMAPLEMFGDFDSTAVQLEDLRAKLLQEFFGTAAIGRPSGAFGLVAETGSAPPAPQRRRRVRPGGDRFTDEEYTRIQVNQELEKRVKVFLEIAEARLDEIERRVAGREWQKKEENPLEFFTYRDMVHAYRRALDSLMINIDEKATHKTAEEKEIIKSLKLLNQKIQGFIPRLEPIKQLAAALKDRDLYETVLEAEEASLVAQKGSQYGLGAPEKP